MSPTIVTINLEYQGFEISKGITKFFFSVESPE